jgi:CRISPR-associated endonuclease/helicase Cas3
MSKLDFGQVFKEATGFVPFGYQCRLACGKDADPNNPDSLRSSSECASKLINIPTGLGKTAAVVLAWLWNRVLNSDESRRTSWPRRLVYCLPMRTLVEQTVAETTKWISEIHKADLVCARNPWEGVVRFFQSKFSYGNQGYMSHLFLWLGCSQ